MAKPSRLVRTYKVASIAVTILAVAYLVLLTFPQALFAYTTEHNNFRIYSREPIRPELATVIKSAETRLKSSPIYDETFRNDLYLTDGHGVYALLSHKAYKSFANNIPYIENIIINKSDVVADRVFLNREKNNSRSLSGVIAHEVTHLLIQRRYGTARSIMLPSWKKEGYCEYVAGDSTITLEEGIRLWKENPSDDTGYRYIKYHLMVKHLLEKDGTSVDDLFGRSFDESELAERTFAGLKE